MRRFMQIALFVVTALVGSLSLTGCIVTPRHHGPDRGYSHDHDGHDHDRDHDRGHHYH